MRRINFGEVRLGAREIKNVNDCLAKNWVTMGEKVRQFETQFAHKLDQKYCTMLSSGTSADTAACMSLYPLKGAKPGDEVIIPSLSFIATANAVRMAGLKPVFVDIKRETLNIDSSKIERAITPRTCAVMAVNLMGRPCDLDIIQQICGEHNIFFIVDNCEGYGSGYYGEDSGFYCDMQTTSHYTAHIIQSVEGGCVLSKYKDINDTIISVRSHGRLGGTKYFDHVDFGGNFKPSDLHAAIGLPQIEDFWENFDARKEVWYNVRNALREIGLEELAYFCDEDDNTINAPHGFSLTFKEQDHAHMAEHMMDEAGIDVKRNFGCMATQHDCFSYLGHKVGDFPEAEFVGDHGFHFGTHQYMTDEDVAYIKETLIKVMDKCV